MSKERPSMEPIDLVDPAMYPDPAAAYFDHYGLDVPDERIRHFFGSFVSGKYSLAAHLYDPPAYTATVVLLHGYLNHTGQFRNLIHFLLDNGYAVGVFDLPGHGLSGGESAAIDSFEEYTAALNDFMEVVRPRLEGPYHAIGFSTGCSILIDLLLDHSQDIFDRIVLAAPLLHWTGYEQSKGTYKMYIKFTDRIARFRRKNSSDKEFLIFNKTQDYLHATHLSLHWVRALFDWNEKIEQAAPCDKEVLILQGDKDTTVDWKYNLDLLKHKLPNAHVEIIPGARHELFNEAPKFRNMVLKSLEPYLK